MLNSDRFVYKTLVTGPRETVSFVFRRLASRG